jgi:hypothetical protein
MNPACCNTQAIKHAYCVRHTRTHTLQSHSRCNSSTVIFTSSGELNSLMQKSPLSVLTYCENIQSSGLMVMCVHFSARMTCTRDFRSDSVNAEYSESRSFRCTPSSSSVNGTLCPQSCQRVTNGTFNAFVPKVINNRSKLRLPQQHRHK